MSRELVSYQTGVVAPDGYRETANEYVYTCDVCKKETETAPAPTQDICESCELIREAAPELLEALQDIAAQLNGLESRGYKWIRERAKAAIAKATGHAEKVSA